MEVTLQDSIEQDYEIQEIEEIPRRNEPTITGNPNEDAAKNATYFTRDLPSNSTSTGRVRGEILDDGMEVILLLQEEEPVRRRQIETRLDRRVIELSDNKCKLALRRLEMTNAIEQIDATSTRDDENTEMLRKLPPDTIVTRQEEARSSKVEDSDYKELTETNSSSSGGSSSTSGCAVAKVKRIPRAVRNKSRETVEVRRNPMRMSKKDVDKDFSRPRQRLLANNKREVCENYEAGKRTRSSTTPYMNTRSVTRKMYTVGATYQAPTKRDETEWKEWPVHGMHERPVYHPQVGLAVEYLGRSFVSLDGLSYCEIVDESEIEVVAVDPRYDRRPSSAEKKSAGKAKTKNKRSSNTGDTWNTSFSTKRNKSFGTCMHGSLHCVLGYCSQVMTPSYKQMAEEKPATLTAKTSVSESTKENIISFKNNIMDNSDKFAEGAKLLEGYAIAMTQSVQNKNNRGRASAGTVASSSATYVSPGSQRSILENSRTNLPTLRGFPNASLVLLRNSGAKTSNEAFKTKDTKDTFKLKDASVSEETLSSIYKKLMSTDEVAANREASPMGGNFYTLKRHSTSGIREYKPKRSTLDAQIENTRTLCVAKESDENGNTDNAKIQQPDGVFTGPSVKNRSLCTSEASEIARILSEYNRGATRKSAIQVYGGASKNAKHSTKASCFWQKDTTTEESQNVSGDRSMGLDLSQGKWRKLSTLENIGDQTQVINNDRSASNKPGGPPAPLESYQGVSSRNQQMNSSVSSSTREKFSVTRKYFGKRREALAIDTELKEAASGCSKDEADVLKTEDCLRELLENTTVLYCAANGIHQDDVSNYIDTLDGKQSIQWLEALFE
ncbi:uncharacterized protein LOC116847500 [Odontomachus brunneus]|uniref:uncharacterized protein LOC116847500 n=1 Tax=Odontomachus brunneus TaxID=486640 RepID=UPI0013F262C7|nr:uncharacterized protein LOC116847500 [Odontomachus brunneus]